MLAAPLLAALAGATTLCALAVAATVSEDEARASSSTFSPDPCFGTYLTDTASDRMPWRIPLVKTVWSPDAKRIVGNFHNEETPEGSVRVLDVETGRQTMLGKGIVEALAWTGAGILVDGRDASRPRGDRRGWWIQKGSGARVWIGDGLLLPQTWHAWAAPISPRGRYVVALEEEEPFEKNEQLVVIPIASPQTRIRIPKSAGTVLVGWTNRDEPLVAKGDEYAHATQRIHLVSPKTGKRMRAIGPRLSGPWAIAWSGDNRVAFILEDRQYARGSRTITRVPSAWLLSANPRVAPRRLAAWSQWADAHPELDSWPRVTGLSARGAQVAIGASIKDARTLTDNGSVTTWGTISAMTKTGGTGPIRPEATGYATDDGDFEAGCSTSLRPAPRGTLAIIDTQAAGCRGRDMQIRAGSPRRR